VSESRLPFPFPVAAWTGESVRLIEQTLLPDRLEFLDCRTIDQLADAIVRLAVRGAPAIGIAAAYGVVLSWTLGRAVGEDLTALRTRLAADHATLAATRPTAVNLFWALRRMAAAEERACTAGADAEALGDVLLAEARAIHDEDVAMGRAMGEAGQALLPDRGAVLTHCNAGGLATGGYGTAIGVVYAAWEAGKHIEVFADETRPLLQGARLTAWELQNQGVPVTVLPDVAAATLLRQGRIDAVITGADRIAANGDAANKIGTYPLAVLAHRHGVPFYVAAPASTFDPLTDRGEDIEIEQRDPDEVHRYRRERFTPDGVAAFNPAFDVTPAELITAIITEQGVLRPPYRPSLAALAGPDHGIGAP
jgi:methylthioribose-1-phosphate isomerase